MNSLVLVFLSALAFTNGRPNLDGSIDWSRNVVTVPPNCPAGQEWVNGQCRDVWKTGFNPSNMVTVPPNCAAGQVYVNGQCRDLWKAGIDPSNMVTVPPNCAAGQEYVNGQCKDVWYIRSDVQQSQSSSGAILTEQDVKPSNVITAPPNCPNGQEYVNGQCRDVWIKRASTLLRKLLSDEMASMSSEDNKQNEEADGPRNIISVPNQCPIGYKPDALGYCREILKM